MVICKESFFVLGLLGVVWVKWVFLFVLKFRMVGIGVVLVVVKINLGFFGRN